MDKARRSADIPRLQDQDGSSIVEFVMLAPLVMFMAFLIYDANRRTEDQQDVAIKGRNAMYMGPIHAVLPEHYVLQQTDLQGLNDPDRLRWKQAMSEPQQSHSDMDRYQTLSQLTGQGLDLVQTPLSAAHDAFEFAFGLNGNKAYRKSVLEATYTDDPNAISALLESLNKMVVGDQWTPPQRRNSHIHYGLSLNGFHNNDYQRSALVGGALGLLLYPSWGAKGGYSPSAEVLQNRCMSRLSMDNSCEHDSRPDRDFLQEIAKIAAVRLILSGILQLIPGGAGVDQAIVRAGNVLLFPLQGGKLDSALQNLESSMGATETKDAAGNDPATALEQPFNTAKNSMEANLSVTSLTEIFPQGMLSGVLP